MEGLRFFIEDLLNYVFSGFLLTFFTTIVFILFWFIIGFIFIKIANKFLLSVLRIKKNDRRTKTIAKLVNNITKIIVWFIIIVIILSELGVDITPLIASAGIVGVAVGFGAQSIVKDLISGAFFIMERAYYEDDFVEINGFRGTVIELGLRSTSVKNWRGEIKIVSNGDIKDLINYSRTDSMGSVEFLMPHNVDLNKLTKLIANFLKAVKNKHQYVLEEPIFWGITKITEVGINFCILIKTVNGKIIETENKVRADLIEFLNKNDIKLAKQELIVYSNNKN